MKSAKKLLAIALAVASIGTVFAGCNNQSGGGTDSDKPYIAVVAKGFQHQFWQVVKKGAEDAAKKYDVSITFEGPPSESDVAKQVDYLNGALAKNPVAIALAALDTNSVTEQLDTAASKNIPVIGFDSGVPGAKEGIIKATASTDNYKAAELAAEKLFENSEFKSALSKATTSNPVVIGVLSQDATSESIINRTQGFVDKIKSLIEAEDGFKDSVAVKGHTKFAKASASAAKVEINVVVPATTSITDMTTGASQLLTAKGLIALYSSNAGAVDGVLAATNDGADFDKTNGKYKDITAVGFDAGKGQKNAVKNNWFLGSITQDPYQIGYKAVELAYKAYKGEAVEDTDTGSKWYTSENMDDADIADLLYD